MKTFKLIDLSISAVLIITLLFITLFISADMFFVSYFIVGGWQVISMVIHEWNHWFVPKGSTRRFYHRLVLWMIALLMVFALLAVTISEVFGIYVMINLYFLLLFAPFMAIFYTALCFIEWKESLTRPMAKLKY